MADRTAPISALGWMSLCSGTIGVLLIIVLTVLSLSWTASGTQMTWSSCPG
jgi:hypothetical protein